MDGQQFLERLRDDNETELSRLGSSKALYAVTGGEMTAERVRAAAAADARAAAEAFGDWGGEAADFFADAAATAEEHAESFDSDADAADAPALYAELAGLDGTVERVAGALARSLVAAKTAEQMVGFFVGDADPRAAETFRSYRGDVEDQRDRAAELLDDVCDDDEDWERARRTADAAIESAYDEYVETLEGMGVQPKNVC